MGTRLAQSRRPYIVDACDITIYHSVYPLPWNAELQKSGFDMFLRFENVAVRIIRVILMILSLADGRYHARHIMQLDIQQVGMNPSDFIPLWKKKSS